jgi:hypothetical protein
MTVSIKKKVFLCYATAGKQHVADGFRCCRYAHNKKGTAGNGVL